MRDKLKARELDKVRVREQVRKQIREIAPILSSKLADKTIKELKDKKCIK